MARFDKQVGIITGAASGIGKEIALRYAAEGGTPVIADLNLDAATATANGSVTTRSRAATMQAIDMPIHIRPCVRPRTNVSGCGPPAANAHTSSAT